MTNDDVQLPASNVALVRLSYDQVDDAALDPETAVLRGDEFRIDGYVEANGLAIKRPRSVRSHHHLPLTLVIAPVSAWAFEALSEGTGEVIAGEFHPTDTGGRIKGVIPGDLIVESPSAPRAWFESTALVRNGDIVEFPSSSWTSPDQSMTRLRTAASVALPVAAIVAGVILWQLTGIGGEACEVYCGPGTLFLPLGLMFFTALAWLAGVILSIVGLVRSHARAWPAWVGLAASLLIPVALIVAYLGTH